MQSGRRTVPRLDRETGGRGSEPRKPAFGDKYGKDQTGFLRTPSQNGYRRTFGSVTNCFYLVLFAEFSAMTEQNLAHFDADDFLLNFWQKSPLLIRQAIPDFVCPLSPDELAGLACEDYSESRLVLEKYGAKPWELRHGPFTDEHFAALPDTHWTLLVQDVDKYDADVNALLDYFRFLPSWLLDDIMVSYAVTEGSVGPHTDQYDVFLLQASGQRRWQVDRSTDYDRTSLHDTDLNILQQFSPTDEWTLEPGDILYLPPGTPHHGMAVGECMTFSVGLRAPEATQLIDELLQDGMDIEPTFFREVKTNATHCHGEISIDSRDSIYRMLKQHLTQLMQASDEWLGKYLTRPKPGLEPVQSGDPIDIAGLRSRYRAGDRLHIALGTRIAWAKADDGNYRLFADGNRFNFAAPQLDQVRLLGMAKEFTQPQLDQWIDSDRFASILIALINQGSIQFESP
ncbi:MAG TPA: cupin domain-containing protein [Chromatiaceae bacterium]|nr:cupin domain-containing protein [Chromatiaceae bacterium]